MTDCILLKSNLEMEHFAKRLAFELDLPYEESPRLSELRYGVNCGGHYHVFRMIGVELVLMRNAGESRIHNDTNWTYYLSLREKTYPLFDDPDYAGRLLTHIVKLLETTDIPIWEFKYIK